MTRRDLLAVLLGLTTFRLWFRRLVFRRTDPDAIPKRIDVFDRS